MDVTQNHEGNPTGRPHGFPFHGPAGAGSQLKRKTLVRNVPGSFDANCFPEVSKPVQFKNRFLTLATLS